MTLYFIQISAMLGILVLTLIMGYIPLSSNNLSNRNNRCWGYGEAFACGTFLSISFFHLLPEAFEHFHKLHPENNYFNIGNITLTTIALLIIIENCFRKYIKEGSRPKLYISYLLVFIMSIHAFFTGTVLGDNNSVSSILIILVAIFAHKGSEAFALALYLRQNEASWRHNILILILYSLMTPIGVVLGMLFNYQQSEVSANLSHAYLHSITAGTLLYIALFHNLKSLIKFRKHSNYPNFACILILSFLLYPFICSSLL